MRFRKCLFWMVAAVFLIPGCGSRFLKTEYVEGVVTYNGKPIEGATVIFQSADESKGFQAGTGMTDANGVYKLSTTGGKGEAGVPAGEYKVAIKKQKVIDDGKENTPTTQEEYTEQMEKSGGLQLKVPKTEWIIPKKYSMVQSSGLTATVKKGENEISFKLEK